jgi:hypothetical protein
VIANAGFEQDGPTRVIRPMACLPRATAQVFHVSDVQSLSRVEVALRRTSTASLEDKSTTSSLSLLHPTTRRQKSRCSVALQRIMRHKLNLSYDYYGTFKDPRLRLTGMLVRALMYNTSRVASKARRRCLKSSTIPLKATRVPAARVLFQEMMQQDAAGGVGG